jgi:dTDP-4-amino-4,6-dideoxygalactose transaminase
MTNSPVRVPLLDLKAQYATIREEIQVALLRVAESQQFILGPEVEAFEREIAAYIGCAYALGVSSGTDAILASLMAVGIGAGDEVVTAPYTFSATAQAVVRLGARPVFVDIDPLTLNINPAAVEGALTPRTRAILPIHLYGQMAEMEPIAEIAHQRHLYVVEDAAQALGATYRGQAAGTVGDLGCFSFFPSKNLGGFGDGGLVTSNDPELARRIRLLRNHGQEPKYHTRLLGGNFRLDAIQAAVLRVKLGHLDAWTLARQAHARIYRRLFAEAGLVLDPGQRERLDRQRGLILPCEAAARRHIYNQFTIWAGRRDALRAFLSARGIGSEVYYPVPMHLQESLGFLGHRVGDFPVSELAAAHTVSLPIYPELSEAMQVAVVEAIAEFYQQL